MQVKTQKQKENNPLKKQRETDDLFDIVEEAEKAHGEV